MIRLMLPMLLVAAAAPQDAEPISPRQQARIDKALKGLTPGEAQRCVDRFRIVGTNTFESTILYREGRDRIYRNTPNAGCRGLARGDLVVSQTLNGRMCRGDPVQTRERTSGRLSGACSLGDFVPYTR
jgi:hypothetical protein